ncbi:MAG: hypothetical protein Q4G71_02645 [Pseudomonadota bacterium]|nr:hypothetical protein [Pseudomonadota bacterium]
MKPAPFAPRHRRTRRHARGRALAALALTSLAVAMLLLAATAPAHASAVAQPPGGNWGVADSTITLTPPHPPPIQPQIPQGPTAPAIDTRARPGSPEMGRNLRPDGPNAGPASGAPGPQMPTAVTPAQRAALTALRRAAEPASGFGSTNAAANAAWTLGLIELHGGVVPRSPSQAQTWFERATRLGRQPLAQAGLAWCYIEGCKGPPDPAAARQAIAQLRPRYPGRALYLDWVLTSRLQPLTVGAPDAQGVTGFELPMRGMLLRAAAEGDVQARIELGLEALARGDLKGARDYFQAAAPRSAAAAANLQLLERRTARPASPAAAPGDAAALLAQARRFHRGEGVPVNYAEALRLYRAAADKGSAEARRMLALITSRPQPDGSVNIGWMAELAQLDMSSSLPQIDVRGLVPLMSRDPTPLFDLVPENWQRELLKAGR